MFAILRFLWNSTRGHRLMPWRSDFLRWRVETYSGKRAETLTDADVFRFVWQNRWDLLEYLFWVARIQREAGKHA